MTKIHRRSTPSVPIGSLKIGSRQPVCIQAMTDSPTADVRATLRQIRELVQAGAEMVRITVNDDQAAISVPKIITALRRKGIQCPIIGDFHFNGHILLSRFPQTAQCLDKYRINPGNIGRGKKHDENFSAFIQTALKYGKPVRIGINSGSLDRDILTDLMTRNARLARPRSGSEILCRAMIASALSSARYALKLGLPKNRIVLSVKMSGVQETVRAYELLAGQCDFALHLGLTEAGSNTDGIVSSCAALAILLQKGIGDTIRISLTPTPGAPKKQEVEICQALLQSLGLRYFIPQVVSCPGCGRTRSRLFQQLAQDVKKHVKNNLNTWRSLYPGVEKTRIAVMGCVVNGPGESQQADIGISLPGQSEKAAAVVYANGQKISTLKNKNLPESFLKILDHYLKRTFTQTQTTRISSEESLCKRRGGYEHRI